jgi:RNA polymerase sigma factor (sigma-70 family)
MGQNPNAPIDIGSYEGLVHKTALMFHERVGLELEDMRQELRIKVFRSIEKYDAARCKTSEEKWVFSCLTNFVRDLKRTAPTRKGPHVTYIEEYGTHGSKDNYTTDDFSWFEHMYGQEATHDQVYGQVEDSFVLPPTVTADETKIVRLIETGYSQAEIAKQLNVPPWRIRDAMVALRRKLSALQPVAA